MTTQQIKELVKELTMKDVVEESMGVEHKAKRKAVCESKKPKGELQEAVAGHRNDNKVA